MPPYEQFEQEIRNLMAQGYSLDKAFKKVLSKYSDLAGEADRLLVIKQRIAREG